MPSVSDGTTHLKSDDSPLSVTLPPQRPCQVVHQDHLSPAPLPKLAGKICHYVQDPLEPDPQADLFERLSDRGLGRGLSRLDLAPRKAPEPPVGRLRPLHQQNPAVPADGGPRAQDDARAADHEGLECGTRFKTC